MGINGLIACSNHKPHQDGWDKANMRDVDPVDPRIQRAITQTQDSLAIFLSRFKAHSNDTSYQFYIKSAFEEGAHVESMWSRPIEIVGQNSYYGT